jgi:hypothetical protein
LSSEFRTPREVASHVVQHYRFLTGPAPQE